MGSHWLSKRAITTTQAVIVIVIIVAAVGVGAYYATLPAPATTTTTTTSTTTTTVPPPTRNKIGLVTDIGGRGDLSFNDMGFLGADRASDAFGWELVELVSNTPDDYLPNMRLLARRGDMNIIIAVGFLLTAAVNQTAQEFPQEKFAIIDGFIPNLPNVLSIVFRENEGSALVGALAALLAAQYNKPHVGMALGIEIPVLYHFEAGYKWGVDWALQWYQQKFPGQTPPIVQTPTRERVLWTYTGTFSDVGKGFEAAKSQFAQGAVAVYNVGGPIGLGIFRAAQELGESEGKTTGPPFGIGVDADQDWIRPGWIVASMMKRVDIGAFTAARLVNEGEFKGGVLDLGIIEGGIAISRLEDLQTFLPLAGGVDPITGEPIDPVAITNKVKAMRDAQPSWVWDAVAELENLIRTGKVQVPTANNKAEIDAIRATYG